MAIGLGRLFGFKFGENFNYPYISKSIREFWRRWHISLGAWFRDYVYFPLGGSRVKTKMRLVFNLLAVWFLTGVWHGANWTFFLWGLMCFVLITSEKLTGFSAKLGKFGHVYTMLFVVFGWVIFRSDSLAAAFAYIPAMLGISPAGIANAADWFWLKNNVFFLAAGIVFVGGKLFLPESGRHFFLRCGRQNFT
jgi:alginate O-acetyltransferase complex protein AlgI